MTITASETVEALPAPATRDAAVEFPVDPGLPELADFFDMEKVWQAYVRRFGVPESNPEFVRVRQLSHSIGRAAVVSYAAEWPADEYIPSLHFTAKIERGKPAELFQFPDDPSLPGLREAAQPETAVRLVNRHVFAVGARRLLVEVVRYRPGDRAVLRHKMGKAGFYVRILKPGRVASFLSAQSLILNSEFVVPHLAGHWDSGGVLWMSQIPGRNMRRQIRRGMEPDCSPILDGLESLWNMPENFGGGQPFDLHGAYRRAKRAFRHNVRPEDASFGSLNNAVNALDPFVQSWRPSAMAHNDFYDDQMLVLPDGRIAVVDFEEAGPGDPMLDAGSFLAHQKWNSRFGGKPEASGAYYNMFRRASLERFGWSEGELNLREAVCLFRICTNAVRRPRAGWREKLADGLSLVNEALA